MSKSTRRHKITLGLLTLLLLAPSCASAPKPHSDDTLKENESRLLNGAVRLQKLVGDELWPGFGAFRTAVVLFTDGGQFLFNAPQAAPSYYSLMKDSSSVAWSKSSYFSKDLHRATGEPYSRNDVDTDYIASAYSPRDSEGHYSFSVFYVDSFERYLRKEKGRIPEDWLQIFWHEVFHNFQDQIYSQGLITQSLTDSRKLKAIGKKNAQYLQTQRWSVILS